MRRLTLLLTPLLLGTVLAGCAQQAPATVLTNSVAPTPRPDADTGAIMGRVTDDEMKPVPGAQIAIVGVNASETRSDAAGAFSISNLAPGRHPLAVSALGYHSAAMSVQVAAGETSPVNISLRPIAIVVPHVESFVDDGFIDFAFTIPSVRVNPGFTGPYKNTFKHNATEGAVSIISTGTWDKSTPTTASWMGLRVTLREFENYTEGAHPAVTTRVFDIELDKRDEFTIVFTMPFVCTNGTGCLENAPNRVAQVLYNQRTRVYTDVYYVDPAASDATAWKP